MAGNNKSGGGPKFRMSEDEFVERVKKYIEDCEAGVFVRPSLSHFCSLLRTTEEYLCEWLSFGEKETSAYYRRAEELKIFLTWLRGQMFSSGSYDGATAKKFVEMQLGKDAGDGVTYSSQDAKTTGPQTIQVVFGGSDPRAKEAAK